MDQIKIGKFIQSKRKENNLTQSAVAEKLNVSDRAVSKWESGICLPDVSNMLELCDLLSISINDLLSGEVIDRKNNENKLEENLIEMTKLNDNKNRKLLRLEYIVRYITGISFLLFINLASYLEMSMWLRIIILLIAFSIFIFGTRGILNIEKEIVSYECSKCHTKFIPDFSTILFSFQLWNKRYLDCPKCNKKTWSRKVMK